MTRVHSFDDYRRRARRAALVAVALAGIALGAAGAGYAALTAFSVVATTAALAGMFYCEARSSPPPVPLSTDLPPRDRNRD